MRHAPKLRARRHSCANKGTLRLPIGKEYKFADSRELMIGIVQRQRLLGNACVGLVKPVHMHMGSRQWCIQGGAG